MNHAQAAKLLSTPVTEIAQVDESDAGAVIATTGGSRWVHLVDGATDAEGKTGLLLLEAPSEGPVSTIDGVTRWNSVPLYVPWPDPDVVDPGLEPEPTVAEPAPAVPAKPTPKKKAR